MLKVLDADQFKTDAVRCSEPQCCARLHRNETQQGQQASLLPLRRHELDLAVLLRRTGPHQEWITAGIAVRRHAKPCIAAWDCIAVSRPLTGA